MNNRTRFSLLLVIVWMMLMLPAMAFAQVGGPAPDDDGDGLPNDIDVCPQQAGPREFNGCPDSDGDGTSDNIDACPTQGGPDFNRGCPVEQPAENPVPENTVNTVRPVVGGECTLATFLTTPVNVREYPASDAPVLGTLDPTVLYSAFGMHMVNGETWYLVETGWVNGIAVVLGGDCGGASRVHYYPNYGTLVFDEADVVDGEFIGRYCFFVGGVEICVGSITTLVPDGTTEGQIWKKFCKGIKGFIVCTLIPEVAYSIWDWWNEDDGATIDPTTNPDLLVFDDPTPDDRGAKKICKGIKGKIICWLVEEIVDWIIDWWNEDDSEGLVFDPRQTTIFVPTQTNNVGDPRPTVGSEYPWCHDILNDIIAQHTPDDGTSPVQSEIVGDYLVTYLVLNPDIPLPQQQPCKKWLEAGTKNRIILGSGDDIATTGYVVEYDSWPPHGWSIEILGASIRQPLMGMLLPAVQHVREAAYVTPMDSALMIDFLGATIIGEGGGVFIHHSNVDRFLH